MGGVSNFVLELGKFLKLNGFEVFVICTDGKGNWYHRIEKEGLQGKYFHSAFFEWIPFGRIIHAMRLGRYMRKQSFDYVLNNHSFYIHAAAGYFFDRCRIIHIVHNQLEQMVQLESDPLSDKVVGVSPRIEELVLKILPGEMVTSILNGIELPGDPPPGAKICANRTGDILFVGRVENRQKGVFLIPAILEYLREHKAGAKITIVGEGPDMDRLKQITASKSLSGFVTFAGKVEPEKVSEYYYQNKIFLLPSNFEGHPLTLLEAMAHGCVPVCTLLPQSTDICVEEGISGFLINAGEVKGFGERTGELLANRELLNNLSRNAITRAMDHFSANTSHQKYLELIQSFEGRELRRPGFPLINRKYMTWKEMVPFQLVLWVKRKILKTI